MSYEKFRNGELEFKSTEKTAAIVIVRQTIEMLHSFGVQKPYYKSAKFIQALCVLITTEGFKEDKWFHNLSRMSMRIVQCVNVNDYKKIFQEIYNWRNSEPLEL